MNHNKPIFSKNLLISIFSYQLSYFYATQSKPPNPFMASPNPISNAYRSAVNSYLIANRFSDSTSFSYALRSDAIKTSVGFHVKLFIETYIE